MRDFMEFQTRGFVDEQPAKHTESANPLTALPTWKLFTQELHHAGNSWSICEEISLKKNLQLNIFYFESFIAVKLEQGRET